MRLGVQRSCLVFLAFLFIAAAPLSAQAAKPASAAGPAIKQSPEDLGLIFNVGAIPLELEAYQAGFGVKIGWKDLHLRGLLDLVLSGASDSFSLKIGATAEHHLTPEPVSLYIGGSASGGYMNQGGAFSSVVVSVGALAGVEYFPLKFLSLFIEYALTADFTWTTDLSSSLTTFDYLVDTRLGNDSRIGIVIYFLRLKEKAK